MPLHCLGRGCSRWWPKTRPRPIMDHHRKCRNKTSPYLGTDQVQFRWGRARDVRDSAQISSGPAEVATILALSSRQINTVAILATVAQLNTRGFSSRGALTLIVILKMTKQAPSPVPVELITGLYSALEAVLSQEFNGVK
ncbi:hypothetical protein NC651_038799 [Populus alba x Populus x berolinensis]|nr:hypothetical protein NC651_038785 [Populus alba x Populus x berolinensis]KAJ6857207.1 hypothetical protein NC651_038799 [Populus alba x Populus x berolinensis]